MTTETERLVALEVKLAGLEAKLDTFIEETRARFTSLDNRITSVENRMNAQLALSFLTLIAVVGALVTIIVQN